MKASQQHRGFGLCWGRLLTSLQCAKTALIGAVNERDLLTPPLAAELLAIRQRLSAMEDAAWQKWEALKPLPKARRVRRKP